MKNQTKKLTCLAGGVAMLFAPITLGAESLHEKVKDYLNGFGLPRLEFFMNQDYFYIGEGT